MAQKYNVKDPKYFDAKHLAYYLEKELRERDFKIKFDAPKKKETAIGAMTEEGSARGGTIKITGNPAKIAGKLPDGWSYDPVTNMIKNGNKAESEMFAVEPIKKDKPIKEFVDMSDVMYAIRVARPDLKVRALDSTTFGIDLNGGKLDNIDWRKIGGSNLQFNPMTGTVDVTTAMGQRLSFNVLTESSKTEQKKDEVREATYTSNEKGIMENGFSQGNRKTVEHTADELLGGIADMGRSPEALIMKADIHTLSPSDARHLWETCNLVPNPNENGRGGELVVQNRYSGTVMTDPTITSQLAIMYSLVAMSERSAAPERNPLINVVTRGDINWDRFDAMYANFATNPDMLSDAMSSLAPGLERGDRTSEIREDVHTAVMDGMTTGTHEMAYADPTSGVDFKAGGGVINEANVNSDRLPLSYAQLASLDRRYERESGDDAPRGVYNEQTDSMVQNRNSEAMYFWLSVKDYLDMTYGNDEQKKAEVWNDIIARDDWRRILINLVRELNDLEMGNEMGEMVKVYKGNGSSEGNK